MLLCTYFIASAAMLTVIQPPISFFFLAWVAFVPFILACSPEVKRSHLLLITYIISLFYWLGNLYWIAPVTTAGWLAFCIYTALLWPMLALSLQFCRIKNIPLFIAVPLLIVGAERLQGLFLGGFFWRHLSHSQYQHITLIQIADIFGAGGLSFLIAMVNGLAAELIIALREKKIFKPNYLAKSALVIAALIATIFYGRWRISQSEQFIEDGPLVASLQSNVPQSVKQSAQNSEEIFNNLLQQSKQAAEASAQLIVWPETMVQAMLDENIWQYLKSPEQDKNLNETLCQHAKNNAFVLVGAYGAGIIQDTKYDLSLARYNSAFLYNPDGQKDNKRYNKIHLVPFGEVVPFKKSFPRLYNLLMKFTPYDYDYSLNYGSEYTVFEMPAAKERPQQRYRFGVMICYEDAVPYIARNFAIDENGQKRLDWLVNISNDGWFVRFDNQKALPTTELSQHAAVCVFRAVENRLAVLRSVNTGISCLIDTFGRIKNGFFAGNLPKKAMERTACQGWFVDKIPIDKRITFYSKTGQWLDFCCALLLVLATIAAIKKPKNWKPNRDKKYE
ncbi:apolipoprotein N-acyltransferase [Planctomycetota bacterium]